MINKIRLNMFHNNTVFILIYTHVTLINIINQICAWHTNARYTIADIWDQVALDAGLTKYHKDSNSSELIRDKSCSTKCVLLLVQLMIKACCLLSNTILLFLSLCI